ncbi:Mur ligase family protein [uncultured Methanobrevibacter sp.]|uniref:Mur ligase family protein n=1 Tax=uncultured Methanobrevibacter sp. TaxID=253161 RepID=UPI002617149B|nr:Mur ligase family protein [uncultured Methanobrevibacter sp.]
MVNKIRLSIAKFAAKIASQVAKLGSGSGGNFPGHVFFKVAGQEALFDLSHEMKVGPILVTGTNGKTTTTTLLIKLLSHDTEIRKSFENNTINSITTGILKGKGDIGVFEYGIRNKTYGIPDTIQRLVDPIGVVYTTISREHSQVAGIKNPFDEYVEAKTLLSKNMTKGIVISNADDPLTANIAINKQKDIKVNFYGLDIDDIDDIFEGSNSLNCPNCGKKLEYSQKFLNHRGIYGCSCGFKRPELNVKLVDADFKTDEWDLTIEGELYNYTNNQDVSFNVVISVPPFGFHNIYNTLASITAYASFTPRIENIENTIRDIFNNLDMSFIPPGRFEVVKIDSNKYVGLGQGDNGDAARINALFMDQYIDGPLEFIYTTPDVNEEEIFEDHLKVIKSLNPEHVIVVPGRKSIEKAEEYYNIIAEEFDAVFYPLSYEKMGERIDKLVQLAQDSKYNYVIMTGCGEEQEMWENIKQKLIKR